MAVRGGGLVDRPLQVESRATIAAGRRSNTSRTACSIFVSSTVLVPNVSDEDADRLGHADGVRHLHLAALRGAGGHDVLGDPARGVRRGAVDLARVLAAERAAAVTTHAAVGVDDDLAAGEPGVGVRAAEHERAGRVDVHAEVVVGELRRHRRADDLLDEVGADDGVAVDALLVLRADQDGRRGGRGWPSS